MQPKNTKIESISRAIPGYAFALGGIVVGFDLFMFSVLANPGQMFVLWWLGVPIFSAIIIMPTALYILFLSARLLRSRRRVQRSSIGHRQMLDAMCVSMICLSIFAVASLAYWIVAGGQA